MKKVILALCGVLSLVTSLSALPPGRIRRIVTWAANYRQFEFLNSDGLPVYSSSAWQTAYLTAAENYEQFYLASLMGETKTLTANVACGASPTYYAYTSDNLEKMMSYERFFCFGYPDEQNIQPQDAVQYIHLHYQADWYYYTVLNQLSYVYGVGWNPEVWVVRLTDPFEDTVWFTY